MCSLCKREQYLGVCVHFFFSASSPQLPCVALHWERSRLRANVGLLNRCTWTHRRLRSSKRCKERWVGGGVQDSRKTIDLLGYFWERPLDTSLELLFAGSKLSVSMAPTLCAASGSADRLQLAMSATPWVEWPLISLWRKSWRRGCGCRLHHTAWFIVLLLSLVACSGGPETFLPYLGFY